MSAKRSSSRHAQGDAFDQLTGKCRQMPKVGVDELQGVVSPKVKPPLPLPKLELPKTDLRRAALGRTLLKSGRARGDLNLARAGQSLLESSGGSPRNPTSSGGQSEPAQDNNMSSPEP